MGSKEKESDGGNGSIRSIFMHADRVDKLFMALGFIGAVSDGFTDRLPLLLASKIINTIGSSSNLDPQEFTHTLNKTAVMWLCMAGLSWVSCFLEGYCWTRTGERQASRMRGNYLKAVLRQDLSYFDLDSTATSDVITSISNDTLIIQDTISEKVPDFISKISTFVAGYVVALILTWQLALASLPFAFLLVIPAWLCGRSLMDLSAEIRREYRKAGSIAEMTISSIRTVYAFVGEEKSVEQFSSALEWSMGLRLKQGLVKGLTIGSSSASIFAMWSFLCYYGSRLVVHGGARGGTIYAAGISITRGGLALGDSLSNLKDIAEACCVGERVMNVINLVPEIDSEDTEGLILEDVLGRVEFKQVHFSYPSRPESVVFDNFSLTVEPRKTVALVGASGSGKSTALALLQRFYNPINGEILLDGVSIDKFQLKWLRSHMALVSQEPSLFSTTVKENILFGKEDADMDDILEASVASDAHSFVSQLPHGYDTQVGERGIQLSGGQKQRIAIARAIIRKPRILLLDEATSALDSESERFFQEAIDKVASGRTTIIVAHRLSSIKNADAVAVMEHGRVKEIGSHEELMQDQTGVYFSLVRLQTMETKECKAPSYSKDRLENTGDDNSTLVERQETCLGDPDVPTVSFRRLLSLNKREWKQGTVGCLNAIIFGAIQPLFGVAMGATVMLFFSTDDSEIKDKVKDFALCFFGLSICSLLISVGQHYYFACMGENLTMRIREMMFSKILTFEVEWFDQDQNSSSILCSRLAKDANVVRSLVGDRISLVVQAISAVMIAWTIGLVISWRLAIVSIAIQPLIIVCFYTRRVLLKNMTRKGIKEQQESTKIAAEAVSNIRTVTTFSSQERILKLLDKAQEGPRKEIVRQSWFSGIVLGCSSSIMIANWCLNYWYGGKLVSKGYVSPREVFQTVTVLVTTGRIIAQAGTMTTILARGWDSIRSVFAILDKETKIKPEKSQSYQPENILGHVELCDISFAYPSRPNSMIFEGFSINVEAGKSLALVGKSGSGKSTVIGLIERFYDPIKGAVRIDGRDTRTYHLRSLRKYIALVNQEPTLFAGTIRENITYGSSNEVSETEIVEAARASNAHDFIARQKDGYNTLCGDRGLQLSGGQKQRIAIARAVLRNPAILLLDEATSALDSHSEKVVQEALERLMMTRSTSIVVAHRLCTIQNCDEIVVLDKGRVVEKGTHSSLMAMGPTGAYHSLAILQSNHSTY